MADQLATPEDLASVLQRDLLNQGDRATAELLIEGATALVQQICGQRLVQATSTVMLEAPADRWLWLPEQPVISVQSVSVDGVELDTDAWSLRTGRIYRHYGWLRGYLMPPLVEVEYTHGYAPGDQRLQLARSVVISLVRAGFTNPAGVTREQIGDVSTAFDIASTQMELTPFVRQALLREYGRPAGSVAVGPT